MTTERHVFPSPSSPAVPGFELESPSGWISVDVPGAIAMLAEPPNGDRFFRASITVSADRVASPVDLAAVAERTLTSSRETFPGLELVQEKIVTVDGRSASLRFVTFAAEGLEHRVLQMEALFAVGGDHPHLFQMHATCLADDAARYALAFVRMLESFRVTPHD
jgi:hypothetical protein